MDANTDPRRGLPPVDRLLDRAASRGWEARWGRERVLEALRESLEEARRRLAGEPASPSAAAAASSSSSSPPSVEAILEDAGRRLETRDRPSPVRVLNATGVVLHTNLGRAPLSAEAREAMDRVSAGYCDLEFELASGTRGSRYGHGAASLCRLTGAEAALVVNNNAAAVALAVNSLAEGREVVVSRGEMVEIGGSFRIPEVVERAGGRLRGVGTTNRTRLEDYRAALGPATGLLLRVHPSNYRIEGFTESVGLEDLVALGREAGVPVVHDLGSGLLLPDPPAWLAGEPTPAGSIRAGVGLVTWSGDKLLGGPQAGIVVGRRALVARLRSNPLLRAFRVDRTVLAGLDATLRAYRRGDASSTVPALAMLLAEVEAVEERARASLRFLPEAARARVVPTRMAGRVGGGASPGGTLPSAGWAVEGVEPGRLDELCRRSEPPLVGRIRRGRFLLDFRTLLPGEERTAAAVLGRALREAGGGRGAGGEGGEEAG